MFVAVVIPVYNERDLLPRLMARLDEVGPPRLPDGTPVRRHTIMVDDGSTDGSDAIAAEFGRRDDVTSLHSRQNQGKGSALRRGFQAALDMGADIVLVQDADLEYDPADHQVALNPILTGQADAVIGTRFLGQTHRVLYYWHSVANRVITLASNMLSNLNLTDIECGTKAFTRPVLERLHLRENRFGIEPEMIAKLARIHLPSEPLAPAGERVSTRAIRIYEVPISYAGRTYAEGKKIGWKDGLRALWCILRYNLL
ncbi:MAG: glycosyltransferase family 2 protein [Phycisphaerales bacterium]|nr:glycosyltransferase family 2 protein [Phycisphaerales bacterium]